MNPTQKAEALYRTFGVEHPAWSQREGFIAGYLARNQEAEGLVQALEKIVEAWKAKQWKGVQKYWSHVGSAIAAARDVLKAWEGG